MKTDEKTRRLQDTAALPADKVTELLQDLPGWSLIDKAIEREFRFDNFTEAMEFVNRVASLSEAEAHHPDIYISYNKVRLTLTTHKVNALSCKDFILATKIDRLVRDKDE